MGLTSAPLAVFAAEVGPSGPVVCAGGRTQWGVGGDADPEAREVTAPAGIVAHEPAEMIVRVRAGTPVVELQAALAEGGQYAALDGHDPAATVGGVLAVGRGGLRRLGWGPPRDGVLEITAVSSKGELIRAGAPLVKNVTGFDLCRLLVGSLGTLAFFAEVVLRCRPLPPAESWWTSTCPDPFGLYRTLYQPLAVLWDGTQTWVGLAGERADVAYQVQTFLGGFEEVEGPPVPPAGGRISCPPGRLARLPGQAAGPWLAEIGVGVVHLSSGPAPGLVPPVSDEVARLNQAVKGAFDPAGRMNPGRSVLGN
jgi:glycolate dehydrogenase FAD-binding subunit